MKKEFWNEQEKEDIIKRYQDGEQLKQLASSYNTQSPTLIRYLKLWGVFKPKNNRWSEKEIQLLKEYYPTESWDSLLNMFPNRRKDELIGKAYKLKIKREEYYWTQEELDIILDAYHNDIPLKEMPSLVNYKFSEGSIATKLSKLKKELNIDKNRRRKWEQWEIDILYDKYETTPIEELCKLLPERSHRKINQKANLLGLLSVRTWNENEDNFIKENYLNMTDKEIAKCLENRTWRAVKWRRNTLGIERPTGGYGNGCLDSDGNTFDSQEEREVFEFIKNIPEFKYIRCISRNHKKEGKYVYKPKSDNKYSTFYPDFVIEYVEVDSKKQKLNKPIILEYYGMYNPNKASDVVKNYTKKVKIKNDYYNSRDDIYFIPIYPNDIKNNFKNLVEKLSSFYLQNFNLNLKEVI